MVDLDLPISFHEFLGFLSQVRVAIGDVLLALEANDSLGFDFHKNFSKPHVQCLLKANNDHAP